MAAENWQTFSRFCLYFPPFHSFLFRGNFVSFGVLLIFNVIHFTILIVANDVAWQHTRGSYIYKKKMEKQQRIIEVEMCCIVYVNISWFCCRPCSSICSYRSPVHAVCGFIRFEPLCLGILFQTIVIDGQHRMQMATTLYSFPLVLFLIIWQIFYPHAFRTLVRVISTYTQISTYTKSWCGIFIQLMVQTALTHKAPQSINAINKAERK